MHSRFVLASSLLVLGAGLTRAAISLSSGCQTTLLQVAASSEANCLNAAGLAGILTTPENQSLVQPFNSWLVGACGQDPCSNQSLSDIVTNITNGCGDDLSSLGLSSDNSGNLVTLVQEAYPTVRQIACLKTTSNDTLCATDLLTEIESATGQTLTLENITSTLPSIVTGGVSSIPTYITCSDCVKEAYNVLKTNEPDIASNTTVTDALTSQCGSSFIDGSEVSGVVEGTGSAAPSGTGGNSTSGAAGIFSSGALTGIALSLLAAVSSAFLVLA